MNAKITVIVPIYNVESYIDKCFKSLEKQTFKEFEVWAVDDGSPDNSKKIVENWVKKDQRFKLILKENGGYGSVLEMCIQNLKTKYFLICDPDDWLEKDALYKLYNFAQQNNVDITVGDKYNVYSHNNKTKAIYVNTFDTKLNIVPKHVYTNFNDIQKFALGDPSPHAKLYKTKIAKNIKFPHKVSYTDFVLYIVSLSNAKSIAYYNEALADYLIERVGNTRTDVRKSIINDYTICWQSVFDQINKDKDNILMYRLYNYLEYVLSEYVRTGSTDFKDKYGKEIIDKFTELRKYKSDISIEQLSLSKKNLFIGLMHKKTCTFFAKLYCSYKKVNR